MAAMRLSKSVFGLIVCITFELKVILQILELCELKFVTSLSPSILGFLTLTPGCWFELDC